MSKVVLEHPVTGAKRTVSVSDAGRFLDSGWVNVTPRESTHRPPEAPDVEGGRAALAAGNGKINLSGQASASAHVTKQSQEDDTDEGEN